MRTPGVLLRQTREALDRRAHRRRAAELYASFLAPGDLCFDVGANVGDRAEVLRSIGARVIAFEPQPDCVATLRERFASDSGVTVVGEGLAAEPGTHSMQVSNASTLSSMSEEWVGAMRESGRFEGLEWKEAIEVPVSTLEAAIAEHGLPKLCKIDVEGFEASVLAGLETPIPVVSVEYAHEARHNAFACMDRLASLGDYEFGFSEGESLEIDAAGWQSEPALRERLDGLPDPLAWGDVYARLRPAS